MIKYSLIRKNFLLTKNYQELPESELEELADLGNVRRKALRLRVRRGGTAFYIHGAYCLDPDIDADIVLMLMLILTLMMMLMHEGLVG